LRATKHIGEYEERADQLAATLREAGAVALKFFRGTIRSWTKAHSSPVSEADIAVNDLLHARLDRSGIGWLSEESKDNAARLDGHRVWIVDPIDGTRAYLAGLPEWSIAVALVEHGRPIVAGVFVPAADEMFIAIAGGGATLNGLPIRATSGHDLAGTRIAGPKSYLERFAVLAPDIVAMPKVPSLALRLARVAQGRLDASFASVHANDWDLAAADLLVHEAGGVLTTVAGQQLLYNRPELVHGALIAAGSARHETILGLVREKWANLA
jgi:myo-inositol-1(or 4)-monophosphatase